MYAPFTVFCLNIAFIAVHSGEGCGPWASEFILPQELYVSTKLHYRPHKVIVYSQSLC